MSEWELCLIQMQIGPSVDEEEEDCPINRSVRIAIDRDKHFMQVLTALNKPVLVHEITAESGMSRFQVRRSIRSLDAQGKLKISTQRMPRGTPALLIALA